MNNTMQKQENKTFKKMECTYIRKGKGSLSSIIEGIPSEVFASLLIERTKELTREYEGFVVNSDDNSVLLELPNGDRICLVGF